MGKVLVDRELGKRQPCALAARKTRSTLGCVTRRLRMWIIQVTVPWFWFLNTQKMSGSMSRFSEGPPRWGWSTLPVRRMRKLDLDWIQPHPHSLLRRSLESQGSWVCFGGVGGPFCTLYLKRSSSNKFCLKLPLCPQHGEHCRGALGSLDTSDEHWEHWALLHVASVQLPL